MFNDITRRLLAQMSNEELLDLRKMVDEAICHRSLPLCLSVEEKLTLRRCGQTGKIEVIRRVRERLNIGLKTAKDLVDEYMASDAYKQCHPPESGS